MTPPNHVDISMHYVETWDGLYTPIAVRMPAGDGPFPMVLLAHGNGGGGVAWLEEHVANRGYLLDRLLEAGYACAWTRYRQEVDQGYATGGPFTRGPGPGNDVFSRSPMEYEDAIAIAEYVKTLDAIDRERVAFVGVSHGGEMLLKMSSEYAGLAAGVACEPAAHEYLGFGGAEIRQVKAAGDDRGDAPLRQADLAMVHGFIDRTVLDARLAGIATPMLIMGRQADDLNGVFRATYEVLAAAGKDVEWTTYVHDLHGYIFPLRNAAGEYEVDEVQQQAIDEILSYLGRFLKG